jgi:protein phosphatase
VGVATDRGRVRETNEDTAFAGPTGANGGALLLVVADGLGGAPAGDVASTLAVAALRESLDAEGEPATEAALRAAMALANRRVHAAGQRPGRAGMGATVTAAVVAGQRALLAHAGDCRAYLVNAAGVRQLTTDHTWVAEQVRAGRLRPEAAAGHPSRHVVTRAVGPDEDMPCDIIETAVGPGDTLVLCSDGLHGPVSAGEIGEVCRAAGATAQQAAARLVDLANRRGGADNITVIVARAVG